MKTAFVYKWTHLPTLRWYVGSRTSVKANTNGSYICSSRLVKKMIQDNPGDWRRDIIATGSAAEMLEFESAILCLFDAAFDSRSFNQHNNNGKFNFTGRKHRPESIPKMVHSGKDHPGYGKPRSEEVKATLRAANLGKKASEETKAKLSKMRLERPHHLRGKTFTLTCPHCNKTGGRMMLRWHFNNCQKIKHTK